MKRIKTTNAIALVAVLLMVTTNPLVAVHVNDGINLVFNQIIEYSGYVGAVSLAYLVGLFVYTDRKHNHVKVPKTAKKSGLKFETAKVRA